MKKFVLVLLTTLFVTGLSLAQRTVTGTISGEGETLIGASVVVKGTSIGTNTDFDGTYSLNVPADATTLVFSYTGFTEQEVALGASNVVDVTLATSKLVLDEVVVTAYGTQTKREITGSVTAINAEEIEKIQNSHVVQGLAGKVPGVQIIAQSGQPGDGPSIRFRGIGSINASSEPLYVVDGVPYNGNINAIAQQDIESMTFLKDASANALYGSRGANGVIIITTKKGKTKGVEVTLDAKIGVNDRAIKDYDVISEPGEYYEAWYNRNRIGLINAGATPEEAAAQAAAELIDGEFGLGYNNYDVANDQIIDPATGRLNPNANLLYQDKWADELFSSSTRTETHLGIRSRGENLGSYLSFGYLDDSGYALQSGFQRITGRLNLDYNVTNWLKLGANANYANTIQDAPIQGVGSTTYSNLFSWARNVAPIYPVYARDPGGNLLLDENDSRLYDFGDLSNGVQSSRPYGAFNNPVATSLLDIDKNSRDNLSSRLYATASFLKDFSFTYNFTTDYISSNITTFATPIGGDAKVVNGRLSSTASTIRATAHQQLLNWRRSFGDHTFAVLVGHESNDRHFESIQAEKTEALLNNGAFLNNATNIQEATGAQSDYRIEGYLSRVNYDFRDRYFVNASLRSDGSSVFHEDNRWGTFYGIGVAWDVAQESFLESADWLTNLRLKASYGQQGNDALLYEGTATRNYYAYVDQYDIVNAGGGTPGVSFVGLGNPDLVWETSTNINAGLDIGLFRDRLSVTAEYFVRSVADLLFFRPLPLSEGRGAFPENIGDMENKGIEIDVNASIIQTPDFSWAVGFNATHFQNKVTKLPQEFIDDGRFRLEEGRDRFEYFLREFAGVEESTGEALWYIDQLDDEGNPTGERETTSDHSSATEYFVGKSAIPDFYGGFNTSLAYKGISLDLNFSYQMGGYGFDGVYQGLLGSAGDTGNNFHKDVADSWTPENPTASIPRLDVFDTDNDNSSDFWLVDASYLSLQDVVLAYQLPTSVTKKIGLGSLRLYAAASNVYLWSKRQGYDPRLSTVGTASNEYSLVRSISFGANVKF